MKQFKERVFRVTRKIPSGKVAIYQAIARAINKPHAARAVGNALNRSPGTPSVPCHRVIRSDGSVGGYASGPKKKIRLLRKEGVRVKNSKVDLKKFGFNF